VKVDVDSGWLEGVARVASPNHDERPEDARPELVVVHAISLPPCEFGGPWIDHLFTNRLDPEAHPYFREIAGLEVSAHVLIRRDGQVVQYVPFDRRAWHAGASSWQGRTRCNDFSIGIELEGCDELPFEPVQYERLSEVILALRVAYPGIAPDAIAGHADIAPGRKTDPGPYFQWSTLWAGLGVDKSGLA
jgi:AmpD protein